MKLKKDIRIAQKYKKMDVLSFIEWVKKGITPKQFEKLQKINEA
jgi:hypothetical protein